jgi:hypothetical protein
LFFNKAGQSEGKNRPTPAIFSHATRLNGQGPRNFVVALKPVD